MLTLRVTDRNEETGMSLVVVSGYCSAPCKKEEAYGQEVVMIVKPLGCVEEAEAGIAATGPQCCVLFISSH